MSVMMQHYLGHWARNETFAMAESFSSAQQRRRIRRRKRRLHRRVSRWLLLSRLPTVRMLVPAEPAFPADTTTPLCKSFRLFSSIFQHFTDIPSAYWRTVLLKSKLSQRITNASNHFAHAFFATYSLENNPNSIRCQHSVRAVIVPPRHHQLTIEQITIFNLSLGFSFAGSLLTASLFTTWQLESFLW